MAYLISVSSVMGKSTICYVAWQLYVVTDRREPPIPIFGYIDERYYGCIQEEIKNDIHDAK